jgi:acyl phosphate:glycerol-3-phosphate acyltransferase
MRTAVVLTVAYLCGAVPFANIAASLTRGVDLRTIGSGTVSGSSLFRVAGFAPLAVAGLFDVGKGTVGPLLAGLERPVLAAAAGGFAVVGHNWSCFLRGAGGRGVAPAIGALLVQAWPGAVVIGLGLAVGRVADQVGLGTFAAMTMLVPVLGVVGGRYDALAGLCVALPMVLKRLTGNRPLPTDARARVLRNRLLFDNDGEVAR